MPQQKKPSSAPSKTKPAAAPGAGTEAGSPAPGPGVGIGVHDLHAIFSAVKARTGHDFSSYKTSTAIRRIERRMAVQDVADVAAYTALLRENAQEAQALCQDMLIGVTGFFRDPEAFEKLRREILPRLFAERGPEEPVRIWHACCASGEEAYSMAILVREYLDENKLNTKVQIFASDMDQVAVAQARAGIYDEEACAGLGEQRLARFFKRNDGRWQVTKALREMIVFAHHSLLKDPPFSRLDLLVCRNFLIYLNPDMQRRLFTLFHQIVRPGGFLFLGSAESAGTYPDLFVILDKKWKIFARREGMNPVRNPFPLTTTPWLPGKLPPLPQAGGAELSAAALAEKSLLESYAPPGVVVNEKFEVIHLFSRTGPYLEMPEGKPTPEILKMARAELRPALRAALHKALTEQHEVLFAGIKMGPDGDQGSVNLRVRPLAGAPAAERSLLVIFEPAAARTALPAQAGAAGESCEAAGLRDPLLRQLEQQLQITHEQLQAATDQLESYHEEFLSANEELMSINEEYQSTNEELETSKEEMQALNEELETVNIELQSKVEELNQANSAMENLLASSEIATVFLDRRLQIKEFTPAAAALFQLDAADLGSVFMPFAERTAWLDFTADAETVLAGRPLAEREIALPGSERCYLKRLFPFRGPGGKIEGIVVILVEITEYKRMENDLHQSREQLQLFIEHAPAALAMFDSQMRYLSASRRWLTDYGLDGCDLIGKSHYLVFPEISAEWREAHRRALAGEVLRSEGERFERADGTVQWLRWEIRPWRDAAGKIGGIVIFTEDMTGVKYLEEQLRQAQKMEAVGQLAGGVAHDFNNILTVITGLASLLQMDDRLEGDQQEKIEQILSASDRAAQLTRGLLAFSRKQVMVPKQADLNQIVQHIQKFLARTIGEDIQFKTIFKAASLPVTVDPGQIEQVLVNLTTNARDAMPRGGQLFLETEIQEFNTSFVTAHGYGMPGRYAVVTLSDSGCGMDEGTRARMFEPFFTTKEIGKGTGLGMSIVYGIIRQHNGFINVYSEPGQGTTFRIYLPLADFEQGGPQEKAGRSLPQQGSETILVAEDDANVGSMVETVLRQFGYRVILARDGQDCIEKFIENRDGIDLILMDMIMPRKNGHEAYQEIRRIEPAVKIIYTSGYTADFMQNRGVCEEGIELVMKPVQPLELLQKIRDVLDRERPVPP